MDTPVVFSSHVINSVKALPEEDRKAIANALAGEFLLGTDPAADLTPFQSVLYTFMQFYVRRDTARASKNNSASMVC